MNIQRARTGMILPLVLVGMLLVVVMSASLQQVAWRALRGARSQWDTQRAIYLADGAVTQALGAWSAQTVAATPIGTVLSSTSGAEGWQQQTDIVRTSPLTAVISARAQRIASTPPTGSPPAPANRLADPAFVQRTVWRAVRLDPPALPISAVATVLGTVAWDGATFDGRDLPLAYDAALDDCGVRRDSSSLRALVAESTGPGAPVLYGAVGYPDAAELDATRQQFDAAWSTLIARAAPIGVDATGALVAVPPWRASVTAHAVGVTLDAPSVVTGLLAVSGDLIVRSSLRVDGLLVVRGALIVVSGAGSAGALDLRGALLVRDADGRGSRLGSSSQVHYAPCLLGRALAAAAVPRSAPFYVWNSP